MVEPLIYEGIASPVSEDGGQAVYIEIPNYAREDGTFIRLQSWDPTTKHKALDLVTGRRLKITVEVGEDVLGPFLKRREDIVREVEALRRHIQKERDLQPGDLQPVNLAEMDRLKAAMAEVDREIDEHS